MNESFHYLLMANQTIIHKKLLNALSDTKLTLGQPKVLDYLKDHNGANQKEIAKACHIEPASLTAVLKGMESKHLIERKMLDGNRRSLHVFLTSKGKKMQERVEKEFITLEDMAFNGLSPEQIKHFIDTFQQIYANLSKEI